MDRQPTVTVGSGNIASQVLTNVGNTYNILAGQGVDRDCMLCFDPVVY